MLINSKLVYVTITIIFKSWASVLLDSLLQFVHINQGHPPTNMDIFFFNFFLINYEQGINFSDTVKFIYIIYKDLLC